MADFSERPAVGVDRAAQRVSHDAGGVGVELGDAAFEKRGVGEIVALGDPDVVALREGETFVPLRESRAAVAVVADDVPDARMVAVALQDRLAPVRRTVVEQHHFDIGVGLREHRVDTLSQIG